MGASLAEIRTDWERLWMLTVLYFAVAAACAQFRSVRTRDHAVVV
jgi:hypothetical protein